MRGEQDVGVAKSGVGTAKDAHHISQGHRLLFGRGEARGEGQAVPPFWIAFANSPSRMATVGWSAGAIERHQIEDGAVAAFPVLRRSTAPGSGRGRQRRSGKPGDPERNCVGRRWRSLCPSRRRASVALTFTRSSGLKHSTGAASRVTAPTQRESGRGRILSDFVAGARQFQVAPAVTGSKVANFAV